MVMFNAYNLTTDRLGSTSGVVRTKQTTHFFKSKLFFFSFPIEQFGERASFD